MNKPHQISTKNLSLDVIDKLLKEKQRLALSSDAKKRIVKCRAYLDKKMGSHKDPIYGINTGFGSLYNKSIASHELSQLQENLVMSHACGMGSEVPLEIVKLMLLLKIQGLSYGNSGVQLQTVQRLIDMYNNDVLPVVYTQGSLGASGDLSPLAHLCLPLINKGEVVYGNKKHPANAVNKMLGWEPIQLASKEGLALLNGTQFMSSYAVWNVLQAKKIAAQADIIGAVSLDSFDGRIDPFHASIHKIRPHAGQIEVAANFRKLLKGSKLIVRKKQHVQDPYSFRCIPQVHGASRDTIRYVEQVVTTEINSVTDNPTVFPDSDEVISAGNFHGQPLALVLDFLAIAVAELANISERRTYQMISGLRGLPHFLVSNPGLNSGFMIPQYTAASIVSQNKQLCTPASVDSIVSSNGQEDHVSMGANAATKCLQVVENTWRVLGIELFNAAQALEFRRPERSSPELEKYVAGFRKVVSSVKEDKVMYDEMNKAVTFIKQQ